MGESVSLHFVVPEPASFPSGGNLYNARLMEALSGLGVELRHWTWERFAAGVSASGADCFFFDSLYLEALAAWPGALPARSFLLAHLLPGMRGAPTVAEGQVLKRVSGVVVTGEWARECLVGRLAPEQQCLLVPPAPLFEGRSLAPKAPEPTALVVAHLLPGKGILEWLQALAALAGGRSPIQGQIWVVGSLERDPAYAASCMRLVRQTPALEGRVSFLGACPPARLGRFYGRAHFFVSPSRFESFGMALQEAVGFGLPLLALRGGNVAAHIREGVNGLLFDAAEALAEATLSWLAHPRRMAPYREAAETLRPIGSPSWEAAARHLLAALQGGAG